MLNLFLNNLANYGLNQNIYINSGYGALLLGREKKYRFFRHLNILFLLLGIGIISIATYFFNKFVIVKFDMSEIKVGFVVILSGLYNLLVSVLWSKMSRFGQYLYEKSCSYVFDLVFSVFIILSFDMSLAFLPFLMSLLAGLVVTFVTNLILGFYIESINKSTLKVCIRNVSARFYLIAVFAILVFYLGRLI